MVISKKKAFIRVTTLFFLIFIDQIIKFFIRIYDPSIDLGILRIVFLKNTGIAFSIFTGYNSILILVGLVFVGLAIYFHEYLIKEFSYFAFILILAGAISNLIDRIFLGYVVDMISVLSFPVFNIADSMITLGAILILVKYVMEELKNRKKDHIS